MLAHLVVLLLHHCHVQGDASKLRLTSQSDLLPAVYEAGVLALCSAPRPDCCTLMMKCMAQVIYGREVLYNIPRGDSAGLKGIIFAFHGCDQWVTEWGYRSPACPYCAGKLGSQDS